MTHVLDEPIEATEDAIHESFLHRHVYDWWEPGTPKKQKQEARNSLRSMVAVLRILRAEREGRRECAAPPGPDGERPDCDAYEASESGAPCPPGYCAVKREPTPDELRAEGRRLAGARDADGSPWRR